MFVTSSNKIITPIKKILITDFSPLTKAFINATESVKHSKSLAKQQINVLINS